MPRKHTPAAAPADALVPHVIHPNSVYSVVQARTLLGLARSTIRSEVRQGRLRVSRRAGRYYLLGEWLLEWLRGGEVMTGQRRPGRLPRSPGE